MAKSTVHEYLYTLTDQGYLVNHDGTYHLALRFFEHGVTARNRYEILEVVKPTLEELVDETDEVAWYIVEEHGKAVYLANAFGKDSIQTHARVGKREYLHCLATGKVILAHLPPERVSEIIEQHGIPKQTPDTVTTIEELREQLETIREQGYGINEGEAARHVSAIATPVFADNDDIVGGICISGPSRRLEMKNFKTEFPDIMLSASDEIQLRFDWDDRGSFRASR